MTPSTGMTREEAREEAKKLWGPRVDSVQLGRSFFLGVQVSRDRWDWRAHGTSWAEAVADANAQEAGRKKKGEALREKFSRVPVRIDGDVIVREWHGVEHIVTRDGDGFTYLGVRYTSLTAIAKSITNARSISGPRFFGVDQKGGAA